MTATNHALSGALLGAFLPLPLAIPLALVSHFVLDSLPHYGVEGKKRNSSSIYKAIILSDSAIAVAIAVISVIFQQWQMLLCGVIAYGPDATLIRYYFTHGKSLNIVPDNRFMRFHLGIQHEYPWGIFVELAVAGAMFPIFFSQL